jgi:hypothetical protein
LATANDRYAIFTCFPELEAVELVVLLALVAAAFAPEVALELLELDDPHAARDSDTAAKPTAIAILRRERNPAVILIWCAPSSASSGATPSNPLSALSLVHRT